MSAHVVVLISHLHSILVLIMHALHSRHRILHSIHSKGIDYNRITLDYNCLQTIVMFQ